MENKNEGASNSNMVAGKERKRDKYNKLTIGFCQNLCKNGNVHTVRMIGSTEHVLGLVVKHVDKQAVYLRGDEDGVFASEAFINAFSFGGVVVVDTKSERVARGLLQLVQEKHLDLGGCGVDMHEKFFCVLHYDNMEDYFLNGKMYCI